MKLIRPIACHLSALVATMIFALLLALPGMVSAASPYLAYAYPAGGQKGSTFTVLIGGQSLKGVTAAEVTGGGVKITVAGYVPSGGPLNSLQQEELRRLISDYTAVATNKKFPTDVAESTVQFPDIPDLRDLDTKSVEQLKEISDKYLNTSRRPVAPMAEQVTLNITIDKNATPGTRELRLRTSSGYSNPLVFQIGSIPEISEPEAMIDKGTNHVSANPVNVPVVLNGQIMPGDIDRFPLQLKAGQSIVAVAYARALIPYLADAVPGWFQAVIALYDANGREVAYADDCGYDPDPVLTYRVPKDGTYFLEVHDGVFRGRRDFVYRMAVGYDSMISALLPAGTRGGVRFANAGSVSQVAAAAEAKAVPSWTDLPAAAEQESNDTVKQAMTVALPQVVRGSISEPGDIDYYQFSGKAGDEVVAEVLARRAGSALDSLVRLLDASGKVLAWNDDTQDKGAGLLTHHADSYIRFRLPETGLYTLQVSDAQRHGGSEYTYSLRISRPMPDFALWVSPSALSIGTGNNAVITIDALRTDGWDGEIEVTLKGAPAGYVLTGAKIPPGRSQIRMILTKPSSTLEFLQLEGRANINGIAVTRPVQPVDRMMQAFANYHLVPSQNAKISVVRMSSKGPEIKLSTNETVQIPSGGSAEVQCIIKPMPTVPVRLELREPPAGVQLQATKVLPDGIQLVIAVDDKHAGYTDNLIFEAFTETETPGKDGAPAVKKKTSIGFLPAIPIVITP